MHRSGDYTRNARLLRLESCGLFGFKLANSFLSVFNARKFAIDISSVFFVASRFCKMPAVLLTDLRILTQPPHWDSLHRPPLFGRRSHSHRLVSCQRVASDADSTMRPARSLCAAAKMSSARASSFHDLAEKAGAVDVAVGQNQWHPILG